VGARAIEIEDAAVGAFVSNTMRETLGAGAEAALRELARCQQQRKLDAVVMQGVMDFVDHGRDAHFAHFAARSAAECLLWFLREHVSTALTADEARELAS